MESVTALEAKTRFGQLLERVAQGEEGIAHPARKVGRAAGARRSPQSGIRACAAVAGIFLSCASKFLTGTKGSKKSPLVEVKAWIGEGRH